MVGGKGDFDLDAAVAHVADEELCAGRESCGEVADVVELDAGAAGEAVVDEEGNLHGGWQDGSQGGKGGGLGV